MKRKKDNGRKMVIHQGRKRWSKERNKEKELEGSADERRQKNNRATE